jgi:hypothetical protein
MQKGMFRELLMAMMPSYWSSWVIFCVDWTWDLFCSGTLFIGRECCKAQRRREQVKWLKERRSGSIARESSLWGVILEYKSFNSVHLSDTIWRSTDLRREFNSGMRSQRRDGERINRMPEPTIVGLTYLWPHYQRTYRIFMCGRALHPCPLPFWVSLPVGAISWLFCHYSSTTSSKLATWESLKSQKRIK